MTMIAEYGHNTHRMTRPQRSLWRRLARRVVTAIDVVRERARLAQMEEHELADIGLDRVQAAREAGRPIWDLPQGR